MTSWRKETQRDARPRLCFAACCCSLLSVAPSIQPHNSRVQTLWQLTAACEQRQSVATQSTNRRRRSHSQSRPARARPLSRLRPHPSPLSTLQQSNPPRVAARASAVAACYDESSLTRDTSIQQSRDRSQRRISSFAASEWRRLQLQHQRHPTAQAFLRHWIPFPPSLASLPAFFACWAATPAR